LRVRRGVNSVGTCVEAFIPLIEKGAVAPAFDAVPAGLALEAAPLPLSAEAKRVA
jgi:hypothetical protein